MNERTVPSPQYPARPTYNPSTPSYSTHYNATSRARAKTSGGGYSWIWIIVIIVIILAILFFLYRREDPPAGSSTPFKWNNVMGKAAPTDTFTAAAGNAYIVNPGIPSGFILNLVPPTDPVGQMFLVTNDTSQTITLRAGNTETLIGRRNALIVWADNNQINIITPP